MIGRAKEWNGLYYIENPNLSTKSHSLVTESAMTDKEKIHLHHCRMGHPSFQIVKNIFPSLFKNIDIGSMSCELCELTKHKHLPFPINNKLSDQPFSLVHTDVWGLANFPNFLGTKWFLTFIDDYTRVTWIFY